MSGAGHYSVPKGKQVLVLMKDGHHFKAKFRMREDRFVYFYDHEPERTNKIRTLSIYKN